MDNERGSKPSEPNPTNQNTTGDTAGDPQLAEMPGLNAPIVEQDVDMQTGDNAGNSGEQTIDHGAPQPVMGQSANAPTEAARLAEEVERLKANLQEVREDRDHARSECRALRAMRKDTQELLESVESRLEKLKAENNRLRKDRDKLLEEREDWRTKALDLEDQLDALERPDSYPAPVSPVPHVSTALPNPDYDDEVRSMYDDPPATSAGPRSATSSSAAGGTTAQTPTSGMSTALTTTTAATGSNVPKSTPQSVPKPATSSYAHAARPSGQPSGVPTSSSVGRSGLSSSGGAPPVNFQSPPTASRFGIGTFPWAASNPTGVKRKATEPATEYQAGRGRHAPRGGFGFGSRGIGRGRGGPPTRGGFQGGREAAQAAIPPGLEWTGRYYVNIDDVESAQLWRSLDAQDVHGYVSGANRNRVDATLQAKQRLLIRGARSVPRDFRSEAQIEVIDFAIWAENMGNHPLMQRDQVSPGVRRGELNSINPVDMTVQRFLRELRPTEGPMRNHTQLISRVHYVLREIFSRPGTYERLVAIVAPNESHNIYDDPIDVTYLTEANHLTPTHFLTLEGVTALSVTHYLWYVLGVPRSLARHVIEPYFRRIQRHSMANRAITRLVDQDGVTDEAINWVRETGSANGRAEFVTRVPQQFAVRDLTRQNWRDNATAHWRWMLPPNHPGATAQPALVALQADTTFGEVEISLEWVPSHIRAMIEDEYLAGVEEWENMDILGEGTGGDGDHEMGNEAGTGPA